MTAVVRPAPPFGLKKVMVVMAGAPLLALASFSIYHPHFGGKPEMGVAISS